MRRSTPGHAVILGVLSQQYIHTLGVFQGATHQLRVLDALAIIGEHADLGIRAGHHAKLGKGLALQALGNRAHWVDVAKRQGLGFSPHGFRDDRLIGHRVCIGHSKHGGETTLSGSLGTGLDGFGVLTAGLAQVHVHIHEPR